MARTVARAASRGLWCSTCKDKEEESRIHQHQRRKEAPLSSRATALALMRPSSLGPSSLGPLLPWKGSRTHVFAFLLLTYSASSRLTAKFGSGIIGSVARSTSASMGERDAHGRAATAALSMAGTVCVPDVMCPCAVTSIHLSLHDLPAKRRVRPPGVICFRAR